MKIKVKRVRGGSMGDQRNYGLVTGSIWNYEDKPTTNTVSGTMTPTDRDKATIEAERGETVVGDLNNDGQLEHLKIGGKRHAQGGTPLNVPDGSFVFSDFRGLLIKNKELLSNVFNYKSGKSATPAKVAKRYELNRYNDILNDPNADFLDQKTAQLMIDNNLKKLGQLALVQESMKGFPDGIPNIALPLFGNDVPQRSTPPPQRMKKGGLVKAQGGGTQYPPLPFGPAAAAAELAQMQEMYPGNWLPEATITDDYTGPSLLEYITMMQSNPRFEGWQRLTGDSLMGYPTYETSDSYLPGSKAKFERPYVGGAPDFTLNTAMPGWLPPVLMGALGAGLYGPAVRGISKALDKLSPALRKMKVPSWKKPFIVGSRAWKNLPTGVRDVTRAGVGAGTSYGLYSVFGEEPGSLEGMEPPAFKEGTEEDSKRLVDSIAESESNVIKERIAVNALVQEQMMQDSLRRLQDTARAVSTIPGVMNADQGSVQVGEKPKEKKTYTEEEVRERMISIGTDPAYITDDLVKRTTEYMNNKKQRGGTSMRVLPRAQMGTVYDLRFGPAVKAADPLGYEPSYDYWKHAIPNLGFIDAQGKATHAYGPSNIWYPKGGIEPDLEQFQTYQVFEDDPTTKIDFSGYGGFDKWKQDMKKNTHLAATDATKYWINKVNEQSSRRFGVNLYDPGVLDVYEPGMQFSTPATFRKRKAAAAAPAASAAQPEEGAIPDVSTRGFQAAEGPEGLPPYPPDVIRMRGELGQRFPEYAAYLKKAIEPLSSPTYRYLNAAPTMGISKAAMESAGAGPMARASNLGVAGKALAALDQLSGQTDEFNRQMANETARANQQVLAQYNLYNAEAPAEYISDINRLANVETADFNKWLANASEADAKMASNIIRAKAQNQMFPYAKIRGKNWDVMVNPTLRSVYDDVPGSQGTLDAILKSLPENMTEEQYRRYLAAAQLARSMGGMRGRTGTSGAAASIFDLMGE